jgi:tetratricopeptide (TPR) repeat protein
MNLQLHDILSNPVLLKDVSDETLQSWIQQYPYVSLFHLYALKNKNKYAEPDLHKTAFYFNNREKLYFLLNNKQFESKTALTDERTNTVTPLIELKEVVMEVEKLTTPDIEEKIEPVIQDEIVTSAETETKLESIEEIVEDTTVIEHTEQETPVLEEPIAHHETTQTENISADNNRTIDVEDLSSQQQEITETTIPIIPVIADDQPLSIADKILLEIQQLKEERARKTNQTELVENTTVVDNIVEIPEEKVEVIEETIEEVKTEDIRTTESVEADEKIEEKQEEVIELKSEMDEQEAVQHIEKPLSIQEEVIARIQKIKEEREHKLTEEKNLTPVIEETKKEENIIPEIIETWEEKSEEIIKTLPHVHEQTTDEKTEEIEEIKTESTKKPLSIQEEVIARIQKIKEERERRLAEENNPMQLIEEVIQKETIVPEIIETVAVKTEEITEVSLPITETKLETNQEIRAEIKTETTEKPLSIQDEIIARIQKIKEDRTQKLAEENNLASPEKQDEIKTEIIEKEIIEATETATVTHRKEKTEETFDIKIVDKTTRPILELIDEKNPLEEMLNISSTDLYEKDIELIESKLLPEIEQEYNDVDVLSEIHQPIHSAISETEEIHSAISITDILPPIEETIEENTSKEEEIEEAEADRFASPFPEPLLVQVDTSKAKSEITPVTIEQLQEETIVPIKEIVENKNIEPETVVEIVKEQLHDLSMDNKQEKIDENASLISKKSDLFIPNVEEDLIETPGEKDNSAEDIQSENLGTALNIQHLKEEPHTFVEWLKLLDGNLQIQTTETPKETDNWIEIPRYEVEQAIAHKAEIKKEEQKLFEPNFEEGEVDLFNEIDEEVSKVASESVSFKQDMMTETLAKIYEKQGKTDKALEIYNTLLTKFPEKSAYFAALIQKIEKEK